MPATCELLVLLEALPGLGGGEEEGRGVSLGLNPERPAILTRSLGFLELLGCDMLKWVLHFPGIKQPKTLALASGELGCFSGNGQGELSQQHSTGDSITGAQCVEEFTSS